MSSRLSFAAAMLLGLAAAVPVAQNWGPGSSVAPSAPASATPSASGSAGANIKGGNPFSFPLPNGFPSSLSDPNVKQQVSIAAHGIEPNGGAPTLKPDDVTSFQLIAFNELFEVAYFTDLLYNVTNNVAGYQFQDQGTRQTIINALTAIQAQEELHADNANAIVSANGKNPIQPCQYKFPVTTFDDAITLAFTFTDVVLGTLQDVQLKLAMNGDAGPVPIIGSVIGQEGEQNGFFRSYEGRIPSAKPFLTRSTREFAFSALNQDFVVPGSCPNINEIALPVFQPLTVVTNPVPAADGLVTYSVPVDKSSPPAGLSLVLINGQQTPVVETVQNAQVSNGVATFQAQFEFSKFVADGLTIAALTSSAGPFTSAEDVAAVTIAGPGLIEIN